MCEAFIDRIYEAASTPALWPDVLQCFAEMADSTGGLLTVLPPVGKPRWIASPSLEHRLRPRPTSWPGGGRMAQWRVLTHTGFVRDIDAMPGCRDGRTGGAEAPFWQIGTTILLPTGDVAVVTAERAAEAGPHGTGIPARLDTLRPHLVRACRLSARFAVERAHVATAALDRIGLPAAILSASGRVLTMNTRLQERDEVLPTGQHGGLVFKSLANSKLLQDAIGRVVQGHSAVQTMPVRNYGGNRAHVAHILRFDRHSDNVFEEAAILLILVQVGARAAPDDGLLHLLFDLTPAEARLLQALAGGLRLQSYAESAGVQTSTVRTQLTSIFNKTGTKRQAELMSIVASLSMFSEQPTHC